MTILIDTSQDLARFCASLAGVEFVTIDTEFMREKTYWPKLCLVQVAGPHEAVAIDPLVPDLDLQPLYDLLQNPSILKVFHAARQDIEIFVHATGVVPAPIFDCQVAAMVCGYGDSVSYESLASSLAGAKIDKSSRFTDWALRPLTAKQIDYALDDVTHLRVVYDKLRRKLEKTGRDSWVVEEMDVLRDINTYVVEPMDVWKRLKLRIDKPRLCAFVRELAAWRELEARRLDVPRSRVMKDETLMEIAHHAPRSAEELARTRGLSHGYAEGRAGAEIMAALERVRGMDGKDYPLAAPKYVVPKGAGAVLDLLRVLLRQVSDDHDVAARLIASSDDLDRLASEDEPDIKPLKGWRRELFGETALALKKGALGVVIRNKKVKFVPICGS